MQLIFDRRISRRTPGTFRTRVITDGVVSVPACRLQEHAHQAGITKSAAPGAPRSPSTTQALRHRQAADEPARAAAGRLPSPPASSGAQKVSHDCSFGEDGYDLLARPTEVEGQRASALRFGDKWVQAMLAVLVVFSLQLRGFNNREMCALLAQLLGLTQLKNRRLLVLLDNLLYLFRDASSYHAASLPTVGQSLVRWACRNTRS